MNTWNKIGIWALVALMAGNVAATLHHFVLQSELRTVRLPRTIKIGSEFPRFSGVDVYGAKWKSRDAPCHLIRMTDDNCAFCKKDQPHYAAVLEAARSASCEIIELSPIAGRMADNPRPGIVQLKYVDANFGSIMYPFVTPETVILGTDWSLRWIKRGLLDDEALTSSIETLRSLGKLASTDL